MQTRKWTNQQGQDQYTTEIVLQGFGGKMEMLDGKPKVENDNQQPQQQGGYASQQGGYQQQAPQQQGGYQQQPQQQGGYQQDQGFHQG